MVTDRTLEELLDIAQHVEGGGLFWPEALTDNERQMVEQYLSEVFGITS
jgi:hypothetical protein